VIQSKAGAGSQKLAAASTLARTTVSNGLEALGIGITLEEVYGPETIYNLGYE